MVKKITISKRDREKLKEQKRKEKQQRKEERQSNGPSSFEDMIEIGRASCRERV